MFNIVGVLYGFDLLKILPESRDERVSHYIKQAYYVPEAKKASELLLEMQKKGEQMAVVVDEYGGAIGIVTIEDLLEQIVGKIEDEYDIGENTYRKVGPGRFLFDARINIQQVSDILHLDIRLAIMKPWGGLCWIKWGRYPKRARA